MKAKKNRKFGPEELWNKEWALVRKRLGKMESANPSLSDIKDNPPFFPEFYLEGRNFETNQPVYRERRLFTGKEEERRIAIISSQLKIWETSILYF